MQCPTVWGRMLILNGSPDSLNGSSTVMIYAIFYRYFSFYIHHQVSNHPNTRECSDLWHNKTDSLDIDINLQLGNFVRSKRPLKVDVCPGNQSIGCFSVYWACWLWGTQSIPSLWLLILGLTACENPLDACIWYEYSLMMPFPSNIRHFRQH